MLPRTRRVQRIHFPQPTVARLGATQVVLVDVSVLGARVEHPTSLIAGSHTTLSFTWEGETITTECRIVRSRIERFSAGSDGLTVFHSGVEFVNMPADAKATLKRLIEQFITRALHEQKLNARGVIPQHLADHMPIFRGSQMTVNKKDVNASIGSSLLPTARIAKESGYVCLSLENRTWRRKRTHDPGQPAEGFTVSAMEEQGQIDLLCEAYEKSDLDGRKLIQLFAQLSIMEGEGVSAGRFEP